MSRIISTIFLTFLSLFVVGQTIDLKFKSFSINDGLSHNSVECMMQDSRGFIWIGTVDGLNKFDGYSFKIYRADVNNKNTIANSSIFCMYEDSFGDIWFGTNGGGLSKYIYKEDRFINYNSFSENGLKNDVVNTLVEDANKNLWIGTPEGLYLFQNQTEKFTRINTENKLNDSFISRITIDKGTLYIGTEGNGLFSLDLETSKINQLVDRSIGLISALRIDDKGVLHIGTRNNGLHFFNSSTRTFTSSELNQNYFKNYCVSHILIDSQNNRWICTENGGLFKLNFKGQLLQTFRYNDLDVFGLSSNSLSCFFEDMDENFWIGTRGNGLAFTSKNDKPFKHFFHVKNTIQTLSDKNKILIGTDGGGVNSYYPSNSLIENQRTNPILKSYNSDYILRIGQDHKGNYWMATWDKGLQHVPSKGLLQTIDFSKYANAPHVKTLFDLMVDHSNRIWICAFGEGLFIYDPENDNFENKTTLLTGSPRFITAIIEDRKNNVWVGASNGLFKMNDNEINHFDFPKITNNPTIRKLLINCIFDDSNGNIWIGTNNGLYLFDRINDQFLHFDQNEGFKNNSIKSILEDDRNNLWISTNAGISVFNLKQKVFKNYDVFDGLQSNQFNDKAALKTSNGLLFFGGVNGFTCFNPKNITDNVRPPKVYITGIKINNKEATIGPKKDQLKVSPLDLDQLTIGYKQKSITFSFVAINYLSTAKNNYAYQLEGFDKEWIISNTGREVTYTNLDPGKYIFRVKACNNDGIWNETGKSIILKVNPPYWKSWWALLVYCLLLVYLFIIVRNILIFRTKMKSKFDYENFKSKKRQELDDLKLRFFTNISHEFRTPLTLIIGPVERILSIETDELKFNQLTIVKRNADRLLRLVNQIMDIRKIDAGEIKFHPSHEDIIPFVRNIFESFKEQAAEAGIHYQYLTDYERIIVDFDPDKLEKVIYNILSNAFKFTNSGGRISLKVSLLYWSEQEASPLNADFSEPNHVEIKIIDTGQGIPTDKLDKIFDRFYQVESSKSAMQQGTGIGLSLAKELIDLHNGKILIDSELGKGTAFKVLLPYHPDNAKFSEIHSNLTLIEDTLKIQKQEKLIMNENSNTAIILVVEDNTDMRNYICENLRPAYTLLEAANGEEGLKLALKNSPDIIISDVMMPKMDGIELCRRLKNDMRTSHIPIVLLTAKTSEESKIEGISEGADEYITKPFSINLLEVKIKTLISNRKKLKELFARQLSLNPSDITVTSADEKFLMKAMKIIEENISKPELTVEFLSDKVGLSRVHLYRKLMALTGTSPNEFIKSIRLKRAAQMLAQKKLNISEVCYQLGFQDPKYFSKCFKNQFGVLPSDYMGTE
jgi:signal transduction histidine kinase/ligand-binding sensor domain-containing protein/DNA-binding response OmpR family regulator